MSADPGGSWLQISLSLGEHDADRLEAVLGELGALAVTLEDDADQPILEPPPGATPLWESTRVTGLFPGDVDPNDLGERLRQRLDATTLHLAHRQLADQDWVRVCLEDLKPMCFGGRLWVCPTGHDVPDKDATVVSMDPGLAFGTGSHPTTALCLEWLDRIQPAAKTLIDYGCGSGILGIAALKLGAEHVWAVDNDPQALWATGENALRNRVDDRISVTADQGNLPVADIIVANILAAPLIALAPRFQELLPPGGHLVMSGLLDWQLQEVVTAYQPAFEVVAVQPWENWMRVEARRCP